MRFPIRSLATTLALAGVTLAAPVRAATPTPHAVFVDAYDYFSSDAQFEAWDAVTSQLVRNFDDICGDTFCEGDYSNIQSLRYRCSVEQSTGRIGTCVWIFAGSYEEIAEGNGRIAVTSQVWTCRSPIAPNTTIDGLLDALAGDSPLYTTLPDTQTTLYDGLADCM
jgi:hypothetical protein